ncbi:MAG: PAS domain S-box protein [Bacteroidales bacterium]|nr:PAS domain S-box protein [Bacteroidales bacterium]
MTPNDDAKNMNRADIKGINASVLGQIMAAQNMIFVLPSAKRITEFFAKLLTTVPGVEACRVCLGNSFSQEGILVSKVCDECENSRETGAEILTISKKSTCKLEDLPDAYVFTLETIDHRFGFFIFRIGQADFFELYKPFINNLGNFVALSLENRLQKSNLQNTRDELEDRVKERTRELLTVNAHLEKEVDVRKLMQKKLQQSEEQFRFLFETMAQGVVVQDAGSKILEANDAACEILGLSRDQLLGKSTYDPQWKLIHEDGSPLYPEEMPSNIALRTCKPVFEVLIGAYIPDKNIYHWILTSSTPKFNEGESKPSLTLTTFTNITEHKLVEQERLHHLRFFECLDQINRAIQGSNNYEQMMSDVLDVVLSAFNCDRAFLMYPCDPKAAFWKIPMERNKPEYPGVRELNLEMTMDPGVAETLRILLSSDGPVQFGPGTAYPLPEDVSERFGFKSFMSTAIYPKVGSPWQFGIHQCSQAHTWNAEEVRLFKEIGRRIADSMGSLLTYHDLVESEQRYRMVFENSPVSIWEEDFSGVKNLFDNLKKHGINNIETYFGQHPEVVQQCAGLIKIVDVNQSALILHEATTKQELMTNLADAFAPESFDTFRQELICLWNGETEMATDAIVKTLNGNLRDVTVYVSVCPGYEESLSKILVSLVDISERKQAEMALINSEKGLKEAQRLGRLGSWDWDAITDTITWSKEYYRIYGFDPTQHPPGYEDHLKAYTPESAARLDEAVKKNMEAGKPYVVDLELAQTDGTQRWITARSETKLDSNGKVIGLRGTAQDITERKLAEEEIRKLNQELEQRVKDRTAQLESTNKEIEAFSYSVSHDLRAPLRSIDGFSQALLDDYHDKIEEEGKNYLQKIRSATQRMAQLIDDLLSLSRIGRSEINIQQVNLSKIVQKIADDLHENEPDRKVNFVIQNGIVVQGDNHLLRIVLENLIGNAWKFTSKHPTANVEFGLKEQNGLPVYFVSDDGAGFDMKYAQKLFGAFQRLHSINEFPGTGIGLATVQRIIHRHAGKVWAEGEVEKGGSFYFTIPQSVI